MLCTSGIHTDRLARLEAAGIIDGVTDPADGRRMIHRLTNKGLDLAPVLVEVVLWAARYERTDAPAALVERMRRDRAGFLSELRRNTAHPRRHHARGGEGRAVGLGV